MESCLRKRVPLPHHENSLSFLMIFRLRFESGLILHQRVWTSMNPSALSLSFICSLHVYRRSLQPIQNTEQVGRDLISYWGNEEESCMGFTRNSVKTRGVTGREANGWGTLVMILPDELTLSTELRTEK